MNEWGYATFALAVVAMGHVISFLQTQEASIGLGLPAHWQAQSLILLAISFGLTAGIIFVRKRVTRWAFMLIDLLVIALVGSPSGQFLGQQLALFAALILVSCSFESQVSSIGVSAIAVGLFMVLRRPLNAWGVSVPAPTLMSAIAASLAVIGCALFFNILFQLQKRLLAIKLFRKNVEDVSQRLIQANLRLQEHASLSEEAAITSERKRLARELHDTTAYTLSNLVMMMEAGIDLANSDNSKLRHLLVQARDFAVDGLMEARRVVEALRPSQLTRVNVLRSIFRLVKTFEKATQIKTNLHLGDAPWSFGETENVIVYRLVQEGMTNALRHGNARRITISLNLEKGGLRINIQDDGVGFSELREGYGITGMRERIEQLGGSLQVTGKPQAGTLVSAWLPIAEAYAN
jgi:signal transduction histidine kinase